MLGQLLLDVQQYHLGQYLRRERDPGRGLEGALGDGAPGAVGPEVQRRRLPGLQASGLTGPWVQHPHEAARRFVWHAWPLNACVENVVQRAVIEPMLRVGRDEHRKGQVGRARVEGPASS
jgi:hypothetical protein